MLLKMFRNVIICFLFMAASVEVFAQVKGIPFIRNYTKQEMLGGVQSWSMASDHFGFLYFANNKGITKFDGSAWSHVGQVTGGSPIRALAYGADSLLYCGGDNEIGYFDLTTRQYHSIQDSSLPADIGLLWNVICERDVVWFLTNNSLLKYSEGRITVIDYNYDVYRFYQVGNQIIVHKRDQGLFRINKTTDEIEKIPNTEFLINKKVKCILKTPDDTWIIGTKNSGLYYFIENESLVDKPIGNLVKKNVLMTGISLPDGYAFGTVQNGLIVTDKELNIKSRFNEKNGLYYNTVLSFFSDQQGDLWVGLDKGASRISLSSPIELIDKRMGLNEAVFSTATYNDKLYIGTNRKLYKADLSLSPESFESLKAIPEITSIVNHLLVFDNQLFVSTHDGIYCINKDKVTKLTDVGTGQIQPLVDAANKLIAGTYHGFLIIEKEGASYRVSDKIEGFNEYAFFFLQEEKNRLWVTNESKNSYKLLLGDDGKSLSILDKYDKKSHLPRAQVFTVWDDILFNSSNGIYRYDPLKDTLVLDERLNKIVSKDFDGIIYEVSSNELWLVDNEKAIALRKEQNSFFTEIIPLTIIANEMIRGFEYINKTDASYLIGTENGLAIYDITKQKKPKPFTSVITQVKDLTENSKIVYTNDDGLIDLKFMAKHNSFGFNFTSPFYEGCDQTLFSFILEGFQADWSQWSKERSTNYTNLPPGYYTFRVHSKNIFGQESIPTSVEFTILKPFFLRTGMLVLYVLIFIGLVIVAYRVTKKRAAKKYSEALKEKENELIKLRNDKLRHELEEKDKELSSAAIDLIQKNDDLQKMKSSLESIEQNLDGKDAKELGKLIKSIDLSNDRNQEQFEMHFNQIHNDFINKLTSKYPDLTARDIKLCAYLKLNLDTKEIASILGLGVRGVEAMRYRVRKKINVDSDTNLNEYMIKL